MTYITREDGQRFVIPSYRDVLSAKKAGLLQKEIRLVANNYGEYIAIQRKSPTQYEVAFSPDPGYLLGETVWSYFKRPRDLIYCEELPNSTDAILVIVKSESVYLDGKFPLDSIADELLVFQTQTNHFDIYLYGNVPISKTAEEGKFAFDPSSVKSFQVLDKPLFPRLSLNTQFELNLVDDALKAQGIGGFPIKKLVVVVAITVFIWAAWNYFSSYKEVLPESIVSITNPYQDYINALETSDPYIEINNIQRAIIHLYGMPGWMPISANYIGHTLDATVQSMGSRSNTLYAWAKNNNATVSVKQDGFHVLFPQKYLLSRAHPDKIYRVQNVIANLVDKISYILPGNSLVIGTSVNKQAYTSTIVTINFKNITPTTLDLIGQQLKNLPVVLTSLTMTISDEGLSGSIVITVLGN